MPLIAKMDSDDSDHYGPATAFLIDPVKENDIDLSIPPSNGMEYLQRVMLEAKRCDRVVTVKPKVSLRRNVEPVLEEEIKTISPLAPNEGWQKTSI